jgi:8-oxo-dGTP diphosphatase
MVKNFEIERPKIGVGVIIVNCEGKILVGKRAGSHAQYYSIPGGHLELGETFEEAAVKEVKEETSLTILNPKVICVTNNLGTYEKEGKHYISVSLLADEFEGTPKALEMHKCQKWFWVDPENLPEPHFDASRLSVKCFLVKKFYVQ